MIERENQHEIEVIVDRLYLKADLTLFALLNMMLESKEITQ
jgi:hypothetical protein